MHLVATIWFIMCVGYLVATGLCQAGFKWWLVLSLSGYSTFIILMAVSLHLFAFYRGIGGARRMEIKHPLTSSDCYVGFYVSAPLIGGLVVASGTPEAPGMGVSFVSIAMGTLKTTFVVWIVIDPLLGVIEMLSPASRRHRAERTRQPVATGDRSHS
jgi:hypothetical protein